MRKLTLFCGVFLLPFLSLAQNLGQIEQKTETKLDSVVVEAYRAGKNTPVSHSAIDISTLRRQSPVHSVPMVLSLMPSVVSSTEGGNGLGYSSLRIRGSEGSRINVTLNGIALNDGESQQVFWVNIPSLTSLLQDIQVQRGVGTSVNGSGAFGASINMRTLFASPEPYGSAEFGFGSYNTFLTTIGAGSGLTKKGLSFDIRFSHNTGDGYIRNAKSNLNSLFTSLGWYKGESSFKINYIMGDQKSGITWEGISLEQMKTDRRFNPAGLYYDVAGNPHYYHNETDNYTQHHIQGHFTHRFSKNLISGSTIHFTKGDGFYENYKPNRRFSSYALSNQVIDGKSYSRSDVIQRQYLDNNYTAFTSNLSYNKTGLTSVAGISYSFYDGDHFGNIIWSMYNEMIPDNYRWYLNRGKKGDLSAFVKTEKSLNSSLIAFVDLQYRRVKYTLSGEDKDFASLGWSGIYNFFNPKGGLTLNINSENQLYASLSVGRKEPGRSDIKESIKALSHKEIKPERVLDYEIGYRLNREKLHFTANIYLMEYKDQLIPTGKLSETGYVIKENVDKSYRRGIELSAALRPSPYVGIDANLSLSTNRIEEYTQYIDQFDAGWQLVSQRAVRFENSKIALSPSVTSMAMVSLYPCKTTTLTLNGRYVGKQYLDNTTREESSIPSYFIMAISASKSYEIKSGRFIDLQLFVDNLLNNKFVSNGWIYSAEFLSGESYRTEGLYPQAEINFTGKISFRF